MSERSSPRRPATFKLDDPHVVVMEPDDEAGRLARGSIRITPEADPSSLPVPLEEPPVPARRGFRWGALFWTSLAGLIVLGTGLGVVRLIDDLFTRSEGLGFLGLALAALFVLASIVIAVREIAGLVRLATIEDMHRHACSLRGNGQPVVRRGRDDLRDVDAILRQRVEHHRPEIT